MVRRLGYNAVLTAYPDFIKFWNKFREVREKIRKSRGNRENREAIYTAIEATDFPDLVSEFSDISHAEPIMKKLAAKERIKSFVGYGGFVFGVIGIIIAFIK